MKKTGTEYSVPVFETVEKGLWAFSDKGLHDGQGSISCEIVTPSVMRSVIFKAAALRKCAGGTFLA